MVLPIEFFVVADPVGVGCVEKVDTEVQRPQDGCRGLLVVSFAVELTHTHATESHAGDDCAL